jgi:hypothetical protein
MTILIRDIPESVSNQRAVPFKLFVPRDLLGNMEAASAGYLALEALENVVVADPFVAAGVSSVFPGIIYEDVSVSRYEALEQLVAALEGVTTDWPEDYKDAWIELWLPESLEPAAEVLDVTDLTQS